MWQSRSATVFGNPFGIRSRLKQMLNLDFERARPSKVRDAGAVLPVLGRFQHTRAASDQSREICVTIAAVAPDRDDAVVQGSIQDQSERVELKDRQPPITEAWRHSAHVGKLRHSSGQVFDPAVHMRNRHKLSFAPSQ